MKLLVRAIVLTPIMACASLPHAGAQAAAAMGGQNIIQ